MIRPVVDADLPVLRDIERAAGEVFRSVGMAAIADDEPLSLDELAAYRDAGRAWVSVDVADHAVAYLIADVVDGNLHIEQVSVHPEAARRGIGRGLIEHAAAHARAAGLTGLTLTTFTDVPWNAPYYERCGFRVLAPADLTPALREIVRREAEHGLDRWARVVMRRAV